MSTQANIETSHEEVPFWEHATTYTTSGKQDEEFVNEVAYVMVTLHGNGA